MPTLSRYLGAMHEIALADNADNFPLIVNNRRGANPPFYKKMRDVLHRRGRFNRVHCQRHNVSGFHISLLRGILVSRTAVLLIVPGERTRIDLAQKNTAHVQSARSCVIWSGVRSTPVPLASCRPVLLDAYSTVRLQTRRERSHLVAPASLAKRYIGHRVAALTSLLLLSFSRAGLCQN